MSKMLTKMVCVSILLTMNTSIQAKSIESLNQLSISKVKKELWDQGVMNRLQVRTPLELLEVRDRLFKDVTGIKEVLLPILKIEKQRHIPIDA